MREIKINDVDNIVGWIKDYFEKNPYFKGVVIGMSGGKDSLVTAGLCIKALGKDRVFGVIMPNGKMTDKNDAVRTCEYLGIRYKTIDISKTYNSVIKDVEPVIKQTNNSLSTITTFNTPPRLRMTYLYAIAGSMGCLVANTSNLSEAMVGYTTKWGDNVGDIAPIANFTKSEVCQIGLLLGLPKDLVLKTPSDGLSGKSDEDNMGITYSELEDYIRDGKRGLNFEKIKRLYENSKHKREGVTKYKNGIENHFDKDEGASK